MNRSILCCFAISASINDEHLRIEYVVFESAARKYRWPLPVVPWNPQSGDVTPSQADVRWAEPNGTVPLLRNGTVFVGDLIYCPVLLFLLFCALPDGLLWRFLDGFLHVLFRRLRFRGTKIGVHRSVLVTICRRIARVALNACVNFVVA
jgi:hypothetical protein